jgi:hypothetical protein
LFCALSRGLISLLLTLTRLVVVFIFVNFSFALFTPPLGDYQEQTATYGSMGGYQALAPMPNVLIDAAIVRVCILLCVGVGVQQL